MGSEPDDFCCPRCGVPVRRHTAGYSCEACALVFPVFDGVPCLVPEPALFRALCTARLAGLRADIEARVAALAHEADAPNVLPQTRERIQLLIAGVRAHAAQVSALLSPIAGNEQGGVPLPLTALDDIGVLQCYEHLFRDWVWGEPENQRALALVRRLGPERFGRVAVYGAGTGRLAVDIHQELGAERTFAFDVNPLPLLALGKLLRGEKLRLVEFPLFPHGMTEVAVERELRGPGALREGFVPALTDALHPPLPRASLDVVVTSWFIDAVASEPWETAAAIHDVLRPGGTWINFGPLRFQGPPTRAYSIEEIEETVRRSGFELERRCREDMPYFDSPSSGSRRTDTVFGFGAIKSGELPRSVPRLERASWLRNTGEPVPATPALVTARTNAVISAGILAMIDGQRSIRDLANTMAGDSGIDPALLETQLRVLLALLSGA